MIRTMAALALSTLVSCGATGPVLFSGRDIDYERGFSIKSRKGSDRILVVCGGHPFGVSLPYAEDWVFERTSSKPIFGRSASRDLIVTVQVADRPGPSEEEAYLQELLDQVRSRVAPSGISILEPKIFQLGEHFILAYKTDLTLHGKNARQHHFWGIRRTPDLTTYEMHFSILARTEAQPKDLIVDVCSIIAQEFMILPQSK